MRNLSTSPISLAVVSLVSLVALCATEADAASFTGTIEMKMSHGDTPAGTATTSIGEEGMVSEIAMPSMPGMKVKTLVRFDKPETVYMIDDARKSYTERSLSSAVAATDETWTVKKVGTEKILGYATTHVVATSSKGTSMEMWTTKELVNGDVLARAISRSSQLPGNMLGALEKENAAGFMLRMVSAGKDGNKATSTRMEVVKIEKASLPKSMFSLPAGYTKATTPSIPGIGGMPPDAQKRFDEAMKNMTPEQRAAMEKAMGGGKK